MSCSTFQASGRFSKLKNSRKIGQGVISERLEARVLLSITPVLENHNDANSDGEYLSESLLTPANVSSGDFGRIFDTALDGQVYAQPLAVANVDITRGTSQGIHNVIYVATMHDSLFAVDATTGQILWQDSFLQIVNPEVTTILSPSPTAGVTTVPAVSGDDAIVDTSNVGPEMGTIATPVINPATNIIYLVTYTQELRNGTTPSATGSNFHYVERLWALNLSDGSVAISPNNPSAIEPTSGGQVIADTMLNPTGSNTVPSFSSYTNYIYEVGPYVKGTGNNAPTVTSSTPGDGWTGSAASSFFAGNTPQSEGYIAFNALTQMGRVSLTLINGTIYMGYASHGDDGPYYGWILGYSASTLTNNAAFVSDPTYESFGTVSGDDSKYDAQGGFWQGGSAITTDGTYLYISTGNGAFNPNSANFSSNYYSMDGTTKVEEPVDGDYGDSVLKILIDPNANQNGSLRVQGYNPDNYDPNGYGLQVIDYFTPSNVIAMNAGDEDLGSGGVLMIPTTGPGAMTAKNGDPMLVTGGKEGRIYLLDADDLGGFNPAYYAEYGTTNADPSSFDDVLGEYYYYGATHPGTYANNSTDKIYDTPSYLNGVIYIGIGGNASNSTYLPEFAIPVSSLLVENTSAGGSPLPPDTATGATISSQTSNNFGGRGTTASISGNGLTNDIVWSVVSALSTSDSLMAYNASNLGTLLYSSNTNSSRDSLTNGGTIPGTGASGATGAKFNVPTVFNGMVYDGTGGGSGTGGYAEGTLVGYGLLPALVQSGGNFAAPSSLSAVFTSATNIQLTWTVNSTDEDEFEIQRSTNGGSAWSTLAYVQHGAGSYNDNTVSGGNSYEYRVRGVSGGTMALPATGNPTAAIFTSFTNTAVVSYAVQSGSTLNINLSPGGAVTLSTSGSKIVATQNGTPTQFSGISSIVVTETASGDILNFSGPVATPLVLVNCATSVVNVNSGTLTFAVEMGGSINLGTLSIASGAGAAITAATTQNPTTLIMSSLANGATGTLDITNNKALIDYGSTADPISTIAGLIASGYSSGTWKGSGIISSTAQTHASYGVGYADSADAGNPAGLASGQIELLYTLLGDANLDGKVNGSDFVLMSNNFNDSVTAGWDKGDFNYSGTVNGDDFVLMSANFNQASQIAVAGTVPANSVSRGTSSSQETSTSVSNAKKKTLKKESKTADNKRKG